MADLITTTEFIGSVQLQADQFTTDRITEYISQYDRDLVRTLLGQELGDLFLADYDANAGVPTGVYATIWNPLYVNDCGIEFRSKGMQFFILRQLWFYYSRDNNVRITIGGNVSKKSQNSDPNADPAFLAKTWNDGIRTAKTIQLYICQNMADYETFNGQPLEFMTGL